jgi:hypothetical protein
MDNVESFQLFLIEIVFENIGTGENIWTAERWSKKEICKVS